MKYSELNPKEWYQGTFRGIHVAVVYIAWTPYEGGWAIQQPHSTSEISPIDHKFLEDYRESEINKIDFRIIGNED